MPHTDAHTKFVGAPRAAVFDALLSPSAREVWLPPAGMTGRFEWFDPRPGGGYRMVLTYDDPACAGKSATNTDIVEVRFAAIEPPVRIVEEAEFVSDDPAMTGTMTMTWVLEDVADATSVTITATNVPDGINSADHAAAFASTLTSLDAFVRAAAGQRR